MIRGMRLDLGGDGQWMGWDRMRWCILGGIGFAGICVLFYIVYLFCERNGLRTKRLAMFFHGDIAVTYTIKRSVMMFGF